jgi:hypothetical protein
MMQLIRKWALRGCRFTELDIEPPPTGTKVVALHSHGLCIEGASINGVKVADINVGEVLAKDANKQVINPFERRPWPSPPSPPSPSPWPAASHHSLTRLCRGTRPQANIFKDKKAKLAAAGVADCIYRNYHETLDQESRPNLQLQVPDEILGAAF